MDDYSVPKEMAAHAVQSKKPCAPGGGDIKYTVLPFFWLPEDVIDLRTRRDHVPYAVWKKEGVFNTTEGNAVDYDYIVAFIGKLTEKYRIREIAYDRWGTEKVRRKRLRAGHPQRARAGGGLVSAPPEQKDVGRGRSESFFIPTAATRTKAVSAQRADTSRVTVKIDGLAASAASVIAMAGTKVLMAPTALMMIHNPFTVAIDDTEEMKKAVEMLNEVKERLPTRTAAIWFPRSLKTGLSRGWRKPTSSARSPR